MDSEAMETMTRMRVVKLEAWQGFLLLPLEKKIPLYSVLVVPAVARSSGSGPRHGRRDDHETRMTVTVRLSGGSGLSGCNYPQASLPKELLILNGLQLQ